MGLPENTINFTQLETSKKLFMSKYRLCRTDLETLFGKLDSVDVCSIISVIHIPMGPFYYLYAMAYAIPTPNS
jgi:hypothetical protein